MFEYAAMGFDGSRSTPSRRTPEPSMKARVDALLAKQAAARECVRLYRLKKAIDETPPAILREARLRAAMRAWLSTQAQGALRGVRALYCPKVQTVEVPRSARHGDCGVRAAPEWSLGGGAAGRARDNLRVARTSRRRAERRRAAALVLG